LPIEQTKLSKDDHHDAAQILGGRELPAEQQPQHEPQLPDEVGGGKLEGQGERGRAPLKKSDVAIAITAYEQLDEAAPKPVAHAIGRGPEPLNAASIR
jgi:hypothetical protein